MKSICAWSFALIVGTLLTTSQHPPSMSRQAVGSESTEFSPERASFSVRFKDELSPYHVLAAFVLPGETLNLAVVAEGTDRRFVVAAAAGEIAPAGDRRWRWTAPTATGLYPLTLAQVEPPDSITLNAFVIVPYSDLEGETLNGYRIGNYPARPLRGLSIYRPPRGFIEVTPENQATLVAPHFRLEQFLCKQEGGWPKYVVLKERLLLKLEVILEAVNRKGYKASTFAILSGYRTPYYNRLIGNVRYSRHVWGGAADIYIDENPKDEMMDDLNADDRIDYRDADVIYDIIDEMYGQPWYAPFIGGLGRYKRTRGHGPFVHVDTRGFHARWGT